MMTILELPNKIYNKKLKQKRENKIEEKKKKKKKPYQNKGGCAISVSAKQPPPLA